MRWGASGSAALHTGRSLVLAAGLAGLQQGGLFALRWDAVGLAPATITVRRKRLRLASGEVIEDDPKCRAGRRTVALHAVLPEPAEAASVEAPSVSRTGEARDSGRSRRR